MSCKRQHVWCHSVTKHHLQRPLHDNTTHVSNRYPIWRHWHFFLFSLLLDIMSTLQNFKAIFQLFSSLDLIHIFFIAICFTWTNLSNWKLFSISPSFSFSYVKFSPYFVLFEIILKLICFLQFHPLIFFNIIFNLHSFDCYFF